MTGARICTAVVAVAVLTPSFVAFALPDDGVADLVLGQPAFDVNGANRVDARGLLLPEGMTVDRSVRPNRLYVADRGNHRVLGWSDAEAFANGAPADLVIGQPDFLRHACNSGGITATSLCDPNGLAVDVFGNLYVADTGNNRVLLYQSPNVHGPAADAVLGQPGLTSGACNAQATGTEPLCRPLAVAVDPASGRVYVADTHNERTVGFDAPFAPSGDRRGDVVLPGRASGVAVDPSGHLYVAEWMNHTVRAYQAPVTHGEAPALSIGQPNCPFRGRQLPVDENDLCLAVSGATVTGEALTGLDVDSSGNLYVADRSHNRVLMFAAPFTDADPGDADLVLGQPDFVTTTCASSLSGQPVTAAGLCQVSGVARGEAGVYVGDSLNSRVLRFGSLTNGATASAVLGQIDFNESKENYTDDSGFYRPHAVALDRSTSPHRIYVADAQNSRILGWADVDARSSGAPADLVIGQPDFLSSGCGTSATRLCLPEGIDVDSEGNLWVADFGNQRALRFDRPFESDGAADLVLGQSDFVSVGACPISATTPSATALCRPLGIAAAANGSVFVVESGGSRVLEFAGPGFSNGMAAVRTLGQPDLESRGCDPARIGADTLCFPYGVAVDDDSNVYVSDHVQSRVLRYDVPALDDTVADQVFGQPDFGSGLCNRGGIAGLSTLCSPLGLDVDAAGRVYVADGSNHRVLRFVPQPDGEAVADRVFGQQDATAGECNRGQPVGAANLCFPYDVALSEDGDLYVADSENHRVLRYDVASPPTPGNERPTVGLYDPSNGVFALRNSNTSGFADLQFHYGPPGLSWSPVTGDWDGDGVETVGVYDPATGVFALRNSNDAGFGDAQFVYGPGGLGWLPLVGDWDGDGDDTVGVYDPANGVFALRNTNDGGVADLQFLYGPPGGGWLPIAGDWDGDGVDSIGIFHPGEGLVRLRNTNDTGFADIAFRAFIQSPSSKPVAGDWNGDGIDTLGIYEPETGLFWLANAHDGQSFELAFQYGPRGSGFTPVTGDWDGRAEDEPATRKSS